ncbi:hypothetical protein ACJPR0_004356, partial [Cronobacter sakazakii]
DEDAEAYPAYGRDNAAAAGVLEIPQVVNRPALAGLFINLISYHLLRLSCERAQIRFMVLISQTSDAQASLHRDYSVFW